MRTNRSKDNVNWEYELLIFVRTYHRHHALAFSNGAAAAEEWDDEDNWSKNNHQDRNDCRFIFGESFSDVVEFEQWDWPNDNQSQTSNLTK